MQKQIGKGSGFGDVYFARNQKQQEFVTKFFKPSADFSDDDPLSPRSKLILEAKILKNFLRQNPPVSIIRYIDEARSINPADFFYVMEKVDGQTIFDKIKGSNTMPEYEVISSIRPILEALDFLHKHNTIHKDIKPLNHHMCEEVYKSIAMNLSKHKSTRDAIIHFIENSETFKSLQDGKLYDDYINDCLRNTPDKLLDYADCSYR